MLNCGIMEGSKFAFSRWIIYLGSVFKVDTWRGFIFHRYGAKEM